jgi:hypothetical protein
MMVLPVDQGDVRRRAAQRLRCFDTAEAGADDDNIGAGGHGIDVFIAPWIAKMGEAERPRHGPHLANGRAPI